MRSMTLMGPVLYFRGVEAGAWRLSALIAAQAEPPPLLTSTCRATPLRLAKRHGCSLWRYDFAFPTGGAPCCHEYRVGDRNWRVHLPAEDALRMAYVACNGTEVKGAWTSGRERNECWLHLATEHARNPFHLLLHGGDQLYADTLWHDVPAFAEWRRQPWRQRRNTPFTPMMAEAAQDFFFDSYCRLWSQPELAPILSAVPSLMMWDDHDIIDGWGSYAADWQESAVFQGLWSAAREHFALFQLAAHARDLPEGFTDRRGGQFGWAYRLGGIGILAPDLRSERTRKRVMGEAGWQVFTTSLESMADCRHVLLLSSVPLVNVRLHVLERFFGLVPGHQEWQDDLIDQWPSLAHWEEWTCLLCKLLRFSTERRVQVTSLSGEIHLGSWGRIESGMTEIHQLTSSGIVHPPPSALVTAALERIGAKPLQPTPDLTAKLLPMPGLGRRFLRARNWLEIEFTAGGDLTATWHGVGATSCITVPGPVTIGSRRSGVS
jgi:PhoD related phosphatase